MVVDDRIVRGQLDGAQHRLHRLLVAAEPIEHPAERVGDVAVVGLGLGRLLDHPERLVEVLVLLDHAVAEVVQHQRLVGLQLQRLAEVGLGGGPVAGALVGDAAGVVERPSAPAVGVPISAIALV